MKIERRKLRKKHHNAKQIQKIYRGYYTRQKVANIVKIKLARKMEMKTDKNTKSDSPNDENYENNAFFIRANNISSDHLKIRQCKTTSPQPYVERKNEQPNKLISSSSSPKKSKT